VKTFSFALSLLAAISPVSLVLAQSPAPAPTPRPHHRPPVGNPDDNFEKRLTAHLGLNATQQNGVHTALAEARVQQNGLGAQMRTLHGQMITAIKAGNSDQIDSLSSQMSELHKQQTAIHGKSMAKIYGSLTADQKTKVGANLEMLMGHMGFGGPGGPGPGPGMHRGPQSAQPAPAPQQ
jgi:Spy/CpxP family protein refolding chaperone